jgi:hypothetical protein
MTAIAHRDRPIRTTRLSSFGISRWSPYSSEMRSPFLVAPTNAAMAFWGRRSMLRVRTPRQLVRPLYALLFRTECMIDSFTP